MLGVGVGLGLGGLGLGLDMCGLVNITALGHGALSEHCI